MSNVIRIALVAALLAAASAAFTQPAAGQGGCSPLDRGGTECRIGGGGGGGVPAPGETNLDPGTAPGPWFTALDTDIACDAAAGGGWISVDNLAAAIADLSALPGAGSPAEPGTIQLLELNVPGVGPTGSGFITCVGETESRPPLPPPLPTAADIWGAALTFEPQVNLDPYVRGLTGLETYMWYEGPTADTVTLTLNGYGVVATIGAVEFAWEMGAESREGETYYSSPVPGSPDSPAAEHTYALPDDVVVVHSTLWTGSAVLTGPGLGGGVTIDLGSAVLSTARAYEVIEVRTPVVGGDGEGEDG